MYLTDSRLLPVVGILAAMMSGCSGDDAPVNPGEPQNTAPTACFSATPVEGIAETTFQLDASCTSDDQDSTSLLEVRWDWENDGTWDTAYTTTKTASFHYDSTGTKTIKIEIRDTGTLTATTTREITVNPLLQLTDDPSDDSNHQWSPDGSKIAFRSYRSGQADIWIVPSAGGEAVRLTTGPALAGTESPQWSPDGERIAFASERDGIWVIPAAGGEALQLTDHGQDTAPQWSPDGDRIAFYSYRYIDDTQTFDVWVIPSSGGEEVNLTAGHEQSALRPAWSPDGSKIAFTSGIMGSIWVVPSEGGEAYQVTSRDVNGGFQWSPDGNWIAFASGPIGDTNLWVTPSITFEEIQLTSTPGIDWNPSWSPDGTRIAFASRRAGEYHISVIPAAGGKAVQLTSEDFNSQGPVWAPDGSKIAFTSHRDGSWDIWVLGVSF
ncbi:DPP IV N-terminal domain-containing protein [Candidatus Eisenbacteria bacterium]|uniref:DPP IV N-terminal domain-containing protein n=1 Tax=Eiseniibacteriota bacterium TaxID=2212470 RepID=A0ABV6YJZ0_UNCEI